MNIQTTKTWEDYRENAQEAVIVSLNTVIIQTHQNVRNLPNNEKDVKG